MSELRADTITASDGTSPVTLTKQSAAKAWCTFDASSGTPTILDDVNVSTLTDQDIGQQTVNFTNNFNNVYYTTNATTGQGGNKNAVYEGTATSSVEVRTQVATTGVFTDYDHVTSVHHGDLA